MYLTSVPGLHGVCLIIREGLNTGTVPTFEMHNIVTDPTFKMHNIGTVPTFKMHRVHSLLYIFFSFLVLNFMAKLDGYRLF